MTFEFIMAISFAATTTLLAVIDFLQQRLISDLDKKLEKMDDHLLFHGQKIGQIEMSVKTRLEDVLATAKTVAEKAAISIVRKELKATR